MIKCLGCGAILQSENPNQEGYVPKINLEKPLCERCFRIQNYNDYKIVLKQNIDFLPIIQSINQTGDLVVFVVDPFFLNQNFDLIKNNVNNPILLVLTKRDLFPKDLYEEKIIHYMENYAIPFIDSVFVSSKNNYNFDTLLSKIQKYQTSKNVYVVGFTNAGKSTLINQIIYNYSSNTSSITTSILPSTTLNKIEIPVLENLVLIDTPGLLEENSFLSILDGTVLKKVIPKGEIHPKNFQIKGKQYFKIEDLVFLEISNNNVLFYFSNALEIKRFYKKKNGSEDLKREFILTKKCDVVITGLGFLKVLHPGKIIIYAPKSVNIYVRDSLL